MNSGVLTRTDRDIGRHRALRRIFGVLSVILVALIATSYAVVTPMAGGIACHLVAHAVGVPDLVGCSIATLTPTISP